MSARPGAGSGESREVAPAEWVEQVRTALAEGFDYFDWLSVVDDGEGSLTVVVHLWSLAAREHLFLRTTVPAAAPRIDSLSALVAGAGWHEREAAEMFGLDFVGAIDTRPLLLPDDFAGHPLRKDFPLAARATKPWPGEHEPTEHGPAARPPGRRKPTATGVPAEWPRPGAASEGGNR
jgi:NADH-quinone oxidoreductase subunit C